MSKEQESVTRVLRGKAIKVLVEKGGWEGLSWSQGRIRTRYQQAEFQKLEQAFIEAIAALLNNLVGHSRRPEILPDKDVHIKHFTDNKSNAAILYLGSEGLFIRKGGYAPHAEVKVVTHEDFCSVVREFKIEGADIEKAFKELDLDFVEFILKQEVQEVQEKQ